MSKSIRVVTLPAGSSTTELPDEWVDPLTAIGFTIDKENDPKHAWWKDNMFGLYFNSTVTIVRKTAPTSAVINLLGGVAFTTAGIKFLYMPYYNGILFDMYGPSQANPGLRAGILQPDKTGHHDICYLAGSAMVFGTNTPQAIPALFNVVTGDSPSDVVLLSKIWDTDDFRTDIYFTSVAPVGHSNLVVRSTISGKDMMLMKGANTGNLPFFAIDMAGVPEDE